MRPTPIAFYAPLKSPRHASPSGDRTMARLLLKALREAGFAPTLASELRSLDMAGDRAVQESLRDQGRAEADRLAAAFGTLAEAERPRLWFTYHVYYKAPDWIGPRVAGALGIPYVVAEGSRAGKRAHGPWALAHRGAEAALDAAEVVFVMTRADRDGLERARPEGQRLIDLPPFVDAREWNSGAPSPEPPALSPRARKEAPLRLLAVAMMRPGDKLASYGILADALGRLDGRPWTLDVVGDGDMRRHVERLFAGFGARIRLHGRIDDRARLAAFYQQADLFVWPAVGEAYGMAFLEAQLWGCPVVAGSFGGVPSVVRDDETGLLTAPGDPAAFAEAMTALATDKDRRRCLGEAARRFVASERSLEGAAARLRGTLAPLVLRETST